jgi:hypothetical protein
MHFIRRTVPSLALALSLLALIACGGDDGGGGGDVDAAPAGPDAAAMVTISGVAQTVSGTSTVPLEGASIEAYNSSGGGVIGSTTSAADGTYAITLTTDGAPLDGYLKGTSAGRIDTYLYPPRPLAADRDGATMLIINQQTLGLLGTLGGVSQDAAKGFVGVLVLDANDTPVAGATVTISPMGTARVIYAVNSLPNQNATMTDASGTVFIANTDVGDVTIDATMGSVDFFAHAVNARAGVITTTAVQP